LKINTNYIELFTDGACSGNPGPGGWGAVLRWADKTQYLNGAEELTTNNRMELMAPIMGLRALKKPCHVLITTDSKYVHKGITEWIHNWKKNNWKTAANKPVQNQDLWVLLEIELQRHEVTWEWVKGHSGHIENDKADELARDAIKKMKTNKIDKINKITESPSDAK